MKIIINNLVKQSLEHTAIKKLTELLEETKFFLFLHAAER